MGLSIQPRANTRAFWWHTGSPLTSVPCGSFTSHPLPEPHAIEVRLTTALSPWGCAPGGQSANTSNTDGFLASAWHYDGRDKHGNPRENQVIKEMAYSDSWLLQRFQSRVNRPHGFGVCSRTWHHGECLKSCDANGSHKAGGGPNISFKGTSPVT